MEISPEEKATPVSIHEDSNGIQHLLKYGQQAICPKVNRVLVPGKLQGTYDVNAAACFSGCALFRTRVIEIFDGQKQTESPYLMVYLCENTHDKVMHYKEDQAGNQKAKQSPLILHP
jgi:hypothetical protein